ncbi:myosin-11-like isoform X2 [Corticium candelabrum]|uniref:myosin-11-like isoform X2 n=1 Tax=Corticium candelabrum TaxID=121492 RepID=UPI002E33558F|nr:myosin-11-like isoform X2 [Corticium candelabrum]
MDSQSLKYLAVDKNTLADAAAQTEWASKRFVWVPHAEQGFVTGSVKGENAAKEEVIVELEDGSRQTVPKDDVQKMNPPKFDKVEDMSELTFLNEASVLHNMKDRYYSGLIYTYSGLFCVVVNPYRHYPIYTDRVVDAYKGKKRYEMPPHIFAIADDAYRSMMQDRDNQSILCTGESGAGKTENTKKVIQYLAHVAGGSRAHSTTPNKNLVRRSTSSDLMHRTGLTMAQGELEQQLLQANPILEAFGNAKTVKNDNSSRFGKFIRVNFESSGYICGASIDTYLLEKSRAVRQAQGERTFHFFYQLLAGATEKERKDFLLEDIGNYRYLSNGNELIVGVNDSAEYAMTREAMDIMHFTHDEIDSICKTISALLHVGNFVFKQERNSDQAVLPDNTSAQKVCHLLGIPVTDFTKALLKPKVKVGREVVTKAQNKEQVEFAIEAISKALYERLFKWVVGKINKVLDRTRRQGASFIGILDIAGFEIFQFNSFEQFCINYTNEKLQQLFNHHMFILEQEEYRREGIEWDFIDFGLDLQPCIDLIEKHPMGILPLLDEECWFPKATDKSFVEKLDREFLTNTKYRKPDFRSKSDFSIIHYAGSVDYAAHQWLVKNMDPLNDNLTSLLHNSTEQFVDALWKDLSNVHGMPDSGTSSRPRKGMFRTVGQLYKEQLNDLMVTLRNTTPHFVRCIIPNHEKKPGKLVPPLILDQLRCNGVLEGIRICRQGFPNRVLFLEFRQRYELLIPGVIPKGFMDGRKACQQMLEALDLDENLYRIGQSKVFFRAGVLAHLEEERDIKLTHTIIGIQARIRGMLARQHYRKRVQQQIAIRVVQRNVLSYLKLRNWPWWKLFTKVKPLLDVTRQEEEMRVKEKELRDVVSRMEKAEAELKELQRVHAQTVADKLSLSDHLQKESEQVAELEETRNALSKRKMELEELFRETETRLEEEEEKTAKLAEEKQQKEIQIQELEDTVEEEESAKQKIQLEKNQLESRVKNLEADLVSQEDSNSKLSKERKLLEEKLTEMRVALSSEEDKAKNLTKVKNKQEQTIADLEARLKRAEELCQKLEKEKRALEAENRDLKEQLENAKQQISQLQMTLGKRDTEVTATLQRLDEESAARVSLDKERRELQSQIQELQEDLESERNQRTRAERSKRELGQELESLRDELSETTNLTEVQKAQQGKREAELDAVKKTLEEEMVSHEQAMADIRHKHQQAVDELTEQLDSSKKSADAFKKAKSKLESDKASLVQQMDNISQSKAEADRRKKTLESQLQDLTTKWDGNERDLVELRSANNKLKSELEKASSSAVDFEAQSSSLSREKHILETQLAEIQESLSQESRDKVAALNRLRTVEGNMARMQDQLEEEEENKNNIERQVSSVQQQLAEFQKQHNDDKVALEDLEAQKKKLYRDIESLQQKLLEAESYTSKLEKSKRRLQGEQEDASRDLEVQIAAVTALEKKQKKFDQTLSEQKAVTERYAMERDQAQKEAREAATKTMTLQNELEDLNYKVTELERAKKQLMSELGEHLESKDDVGRSMHDLEKTKRSLEVQLEEQKQQIEELEDELQLAADAKMRLEVNMTALKSSFEKEAQQKDEQGEEARRSIQRQLHELEDELEEERKQRTAAAGIRRRLESEAAELQHQIEQANRVKEESIRQLKKYQNQVKDLSREVDDARMSRDESLSRYKELDRKVKHMESDVAAAQDALDAADRARRQAEGERDELNEQMSGNNPRIQLLTEEKKRLETKLTNMEEEFEDLQNDLEQAKSQLRKASMQVDTLTQEAASERSRAQKVENAKSGLERQLKELRDKLSEVEDGSRSRGRVTIQGLESRVISLEEELEGRTRECNGALKANRRLEKRMKDLMIQTEEERRHADQYKEQADRVNQRMRALKRQLDEAEEEVTRINASKRKLQREVDELQETNEQLSREVSNMRSKSSRSRPMSAVISTSRSSLRRHDWSRGTEESLDGSSINSQPQSPTPADDI